MSNYGSGAAAATQEGWSMKQELNKKDDYERTLADLRSALSRERELRQYLLADCEKVGELAVQLGAARDELDAAKQLLALRVPVAEGAGRCGGGGIRRSLGAPVDTLTHVICGQHKDLGLSAAEHWGDQYTQVLADAQPLSFIDGHVLFIGTDMNPEILEGCRAHAYSGVVIAPELVLPLLDVERTAEAQAAAVKAYWKADLDRKVAFFRRHGRLPEE